MEIIVKIETNIDFIKSILDEQDPEKAKSLFTDQILKEKFKIKEINNIEIDDPDHPVSILDALQNKKKRWNLLTKNFRKTKRAVKETGKEGVRLAKVAARKTKNATVKAVKAPAVAIKEGVKATVKAFNEERKKDYNAEKTDKEEDKEKPKVEENNKTEKKEIDTPPQN